MSGALLDALAAAGRLDDARVRARRVWSTLVEVEDAEALEQGVAAARSVGLLAPLAGERLQLQRAAATSSGLWVEPISGLEMIWIPPGPASRGQGKGTGQMAGFSLARHPVTQAQWRAFAESSGWPHDPSGDDPQWPVTHIDQGDALGYCRWAGLNLPTEWMWERAARGDDLRTYPWGRAWPHGRLCRIGAESPTDVGSFARTRTPFGCQDLVGNVAERCLVIGDDEDPLDLPALRPPPPKALEGLGPVRGAPYMREDATRGRLTASRRRRLSLANRNAWVGFRPAFSWVLDG